MACGAGDCSTSSPAANAANAKISPTTSVTAATTAALAASSSGRRGTAANVARIIPEENSVVIDEHAQDAEGELAEGQPGEAVVGRVEGRPVRGGHRGPVLMDQDQDGQADHAGREDEQNPPVERTLRSFSHSIRAAERKL